MAKSFALKRGYCHIDEENLMISKSDQPYKIGNPKVNFQRVFFGAMLILTVYFMIRFLNQENKALAMVYGFAAGIIGLNLVLNWNKSHDTCIKIEDVCSVEYKPSSALTNDFFILKYCVGGKQKQRILMLPRETKSNPKELSRIKKILATVADIDHGEKKSR